VVLAIGAFGDGLISFRLVIVFFGEPRGRKVSVCSRQHTLRSRAKRLMEQAITPNKRMCHICIAATSVQALTTAARALKYPQAGR
jgi:hypothetical protein